MKKRVKITLIILVLIIIGIITAFLLDDNFSALKNDPFSTSKLNILIIGYDSSINGPPRADTIIVASIDLKTKDAGVLFIPRDTRVKVPGHGMDRVNASHAYGGVGLTTETLESFLDIPIDYYLETDFKGFARIIDTLGGVTVNIKNPLHYVDQAGGLYIDLPAGRVHLNGEEALQYVRYREPTYGDIGRVGRQQKFVRALMKKVLQPETIVKLPKIYQEVMKAVNTNIPLKDITPFIKLAKNMNLSHMKTEMIPGEPQYINGASYWIPDHEKVDIIVNNLIRSKEYIKNNQHHVFIFNGNGKPGLAGEIADKLSKYGFQIEKVANADSFTHQETVITYYNTADKSAAGGIKDLIGGSIKYIDQEQEGLKIIIGKDYLAK